MHKAEKTKKGNTMSTSNDNIQTNEQYKFPYISRHFAERYYERILNEPVPNNLHKGIYNGIKKDMESRMLEKEKMFLKLFANSSKALVPIAKFNKVVVKKNTLVTIY
tara:strand:+ start:204 stop:524 length:321 start_codon:yes stop_codon:yes gene_type:complete